MARRLVVEIVGDASSLERAFARSSAASSGWRRSLLGGSSATHTFSGESRKAEHELSRFSRGALAGTGLVRGLGRSLAFASGGFLAFAGAGEAFRAAIDGAEGLQKATDSLAVVVRRANGDVGKAIPLLERWAKAQQKLGVSETEALVGLRSTAVLTGSVQKGMLAYTMGLELARAENISTSAAMRISAKALLGQTTSLTRYGIVLPKTTDAQKIFNAFQQRFAGQAETNTSAFDKLRAAASNLAISVGKVLLPIFEKYARSLEEWISKSQNQKRVISAVTTTVHVLTEVFGALFKTGQVLFGGLERLKNLFGSWKPVIVGVTAALVALGLVNPWLALAAGAVFVISHWERIPQFFKSLGQEIVNAFNYAWYQIERGAIMAALQVVEPFSHLPGFLGGWARKAKNSMQSELAKLHAPNMAWPNIAARDGAITGAAWAAAFKAQTAKNQKQIQQNVLNMPPLPFDIWQRMHPGGTRRQYDMYAQSVRRGESIVKQSIRRRRRDQSVFGTDTNLGGGGGGSTSAAKGFTLPYALRLAQAKAAATATKADDLKVAQAIRAYILKVIPLLHGQKLIDAYDQLGQVNQEIANDVKKAVKKAKQAAQFTVPPLLDLALARDTALGRDTRGDLLKIKAAILKFIRTHKHNIAALTDAYNQLASINQQLGQQATNAFGMFRKASTRALTQGLGLSPDQRRQLRQRLSQIGPGGTVPGTGIGAAGYVIDPATGQPVRVDGRRHPRSFAMGRVGGLQSPFNPTIDLNVYIDGKQVEATITRRQQRRRRHQPTQTRGPHAATSTA